MTACRCGKPIPPPRRAHCSKECGRAAQKEQSAAWQRENRDKLSANMRARRSSDGAEGKARRLAQWQKWRKANPERAAAIDSRSYEKHRPKRLAKAKERGSAAYLKCPELYVNKARARRARVRGAKGSGVTKEQWAAIVDSYGSRCAYCGKLCKPHMDHVVPLPHGEHSVDNVVPACNPCNASKGTQPLLVWLSRRPMKGWRLTP